MARLSVAPGSVGQRYEARCEPGLSDNHNSIVDDPRPAIDHTLEALVPVY